MTTTLDIDVFVSRQNGGTQTYDVQNFINMPISGSGDTYSLRTTKQPMIYQPGKSRLIFMTGVLMVTINPSTTTSRMGLFSVDSATPSHSWSITIRRVSAAFAIVKVFPDGLFLISLCEIKNCIHINSQSEFI